MSDTPRTDDAMWHQRIPGNPVGADVTAASFSAGLERELAAANRKIQRLVEAGDKVDAFCVDENAHLEWTAAKEEKAS